MKFIRIIYIFLILNPQFIKGQEIESIKSSLRLSFTETLQSEELPSSYKLSIENLFVITNHSSDTLKLKLPTTKAFRIKNLDINNLTITISGLKVAFFYDGSNLLIPLPKRTKVDVVIKYQIIANMLFQFTNNYLISHPLFQKLESWYFTTDNMIIDNVNINVPENCVIISNIDNLERSYLKYTSSNVDISDGICLILLNSNFYYSFNDSVGNIDYRVFLYKSKDIIADSLLLNPKNSVIKELKNEVVFKDIHYEKILLHVKNSINKVIKFFPSDLNKKIDIIEYHWGNSTKANGMSFDKFLLVDTSFLMNGSNIVHEFIHIVDPLNKYYRTADSAEIFFRESLIEYLAHYIYYNDNLNYRDYLENSRMVYYSKYSQGFNSIFQVTINNAESQSFIYSRTPFVIRNFAEKVGEKIFIESIKSFYKQALAKQRVEMKDFLSILLKHGISKENIDDFVKQL